MDLRMLKKFVFILALVIGITKAYAFPIPSGYNTLTNIMLPQFYQLEPGSAAYEEHAYKTMFLVSTGKEIQGKRSMQDWGLTNARPWHNNGLEQDDIDTAIALSAYAQKIDWHTIETAVKEEDQAHYAEVFRRFKVRQREIAQAAVVADPLAPVAPTIILDSNVGIGIGAEGKAVTTQTRGGISLELTNWQIDWLKTAEGKAQESNIPDPAKLSGLFLNRARVFFKIRDNILLSPAEESLRAEIKASSFFNDINRTARFSKFYWDPIQYEIFER